MVPRDFFWTPHIRGAGNLGRSPFLLPPCRNCRSVSVSAPLMNFRVFPAILPVCTLFVSAGCQRKPLVDEHAVFSAIQDNVTAMQNKDTAGVMATVHSESPDFASTREVIDEVFKQYDLHYTLSDLKVVSMT